MHLECKNWDTLALKDRKKFRVQVEVIEKLFIETTLFSSENCNYDGDAIFFPWYCKFDYDSNHYFNYLLLIQIIKIICIKISITVNKINSN